MFVTLASIFASFILIIWSMVKVEPTVARVTSRILQPYIPAIIVPEQRLSTVDSQGGSELYQATLTKVLPEQGYRSKISLGSSVMKLVENGAIDPIKLDALRMGPSGLPADLRNAFSSTHDAPIVLTQDNAGVYVNVLWPIGLANYMSANETSPINGDRLGTFASTAGWTLGREQNGGSYFNRFRIVELTPSQEALVIRVAQNTYRPCCDNPTFFQDCNHGSALLGLLELGASQGLTEQELYEEALAFNSFWFPQQYIQTALHFRLTDNTEWDSVDPQVALSYEYASLSGWRRNVAAEIERVPDLLPPAGGAARCGA